MKPTALFAFITLTTLTLSGCDELEEMRGVGAQKGVHAGGESAPLDEATLDELSKRAAHQNFGL